MNDTKLSLYYDTLDDQTQNTASLLMNQHISERNKSSIFLHNIIVLLFGMYIMFIYVCLSRLSSDLCINKQFICLKRLWHFN